MKISFRSIFGVIVAISYVAGFLPALVACTGIGGAVGGVCMAAYIMGIPAATGRIMQRLN